MPSTELRFLHSDEIGSIQPIAAEFFVEAKYPGELDFERFSEFWAMMLAGGFGSIFTASKAGKIVGLIGATFSPSVFNGWATCQLGFWYSNRENRGTGLGIKLFRLMENEWNLRKVKAVLAGHIFTINDDGFKDFFLKEGFYIRETVYRKDIA